MNMSSKHWLLGLAAVSVVFAAKNAAAQDGGFATQGTVAIAAERVTGFAWSKITTKSTTGNVTTKTESTQTHFNFLSIDDAAEPYSVPRIGADVFVIDGLSVGGAVAYSTHNNDVDTTVGNAPTTTDSHSGHGFVIAPRVGYAYMFADEIGIWPRAGFSYWNVTRIDEAPGPVNTTIKTELDADGFNFDLEAMLAIVPLPHTLILFGPTLNAPITGSGKLKQGNASTDLDEVHITTIGVQTAIGVWF